MMLHFYDRRIKLSRRHLGFLALGAVAALAAATFLLRVADYRQIASCVHQLDSLVEVPPLLAHVFVGIVFLWNVQKLVFVKAVLFAIQQWQTRVHICVITNQPDQLENVFRRWAFPNVHACRYSGALEETQYAIVWKHREIFGDALRSGNFTAFVYTEDDQDISWGAMRSWAADAAALEPLGFQRAFLRTEVEPATGEAVALDTLKRIRLADWPRVVHLNPSAASGAAQHCRVVDVTAPRWALAELLAGCAHRHYLALKQTYSGVWAATPAKLAAFADGPLWQQDAAMAFHKPDPWGSGHDSLGLPERAAGILQLQGVPESFWSASVLPYNPESNAILPIAEVHHLRNAYTGPDSIFSKIKVHDILVV